MSKARVIFVFGSNEAGRHGSGAAYTARIEYGAEYGVGRGRTGDAYAIPTKNYLLRVLPLWEIADYVKDFIAYATEYEELRFFITRVGCGLAGFKDEEIGPLFANIPWNCVAPLKWKRWIVDPNVKFHDIESGRAHF